MNEFVSGKEEINNLLPWLRQDFRRSKYPCPNSNCKSIFSTYHNLKSHVNNHCGKPPRFKCAHCDYRTTWRKDVKRHAVNIHRDAITPVVELYKVNREERYYYWMVKLHPEEPKFKKMSGRKPTHVCPNCAKRFTWEKNLVFHVRTQCSQLKRYKCYYCIYRSVAKSKIRRHSNARHKNKKFMFVDLMNQSGIF
ncbi:hypothetical protein KQX54_003735 [Cotesia glomerata]|uniref:C2H2-type domain-containing protein n=1 Tax=Cotesia glomerata TaxID=32391 RepID=A0AAV7IIT7_COTGL|nr:hypothetical protein KQX54_003735 [Cotesia glomerata]